MKRVFYTMFIFVFLASVNVNAQNVFDQNDPDVIFTSSNQPPIPSYYVLSKWGHSTKLSWNSYSYGYKSYFFMGTPFRIKYPKTYQQGVNDGKKYPVYIFLHGAGETGDYWNNDIQLVHGGQTHANHVDNGDFDGYLIYPQSPTPFSTAILPKVNQLLDSMAKYCKVDVDRVIVGGLSSGGTSTYTFLADSPKSWAAVTPISTASLSLSDIPGLLSIPVWTANGGKDNAPLPAAVTAIVNTYKNLGGDIKQSFFPNQGHGVWNDFWAQPGYFQYLANAHKAEPVVKFQHTEWCENEQVHVVMILQPGFYQYEWQKDSVTIPGATLDSLVVTEFGSYRARFKRTATSDWSDWSPRPVVITSKSATVTPPITIDGLRSNVLPAPDGSTTVPLMVPDNYATYEWRRVSDDALVSDTSIYDAPVGQYKVRVTEQFGCSSSFSAPFTVIAANGTNVPDKATEVTATATGNTTTEVSWNNNPSPVNNETAFEIYRSTTPGANYILAGKVPADTLSFTDNGLSANTKYYYIVRAVNDNGAAPLSNEASVTTFSDNVPPSIPDNLIVTGISRHSVSLSWDPSTDNVGVKNYEVYVNGAKAFVTPETEFTVNGLDSFVNVSFYVKAVDLSGNLSPASAQVNAFTQMNGLNYSIYQGDWNALPDFSTLTPVFKGINPNIDISLSPFDDYFGMVWEGVIKIPSTGNYTFYLSSDDGSAMYLDDALFINNDGLHGTQEKSATKNSLSKGTHKIKVTFFEKTGGQVLTLKWKMPGIGQTKKTIADSYFTDGQTPSGSAPALPTGLAANAPAFNIINLTWQDNSNNETGFEIYRKAASDPDFQMIGRVASNSTTYSDSSVTGSTAYAFKIQAVNDNGASGFTPNVNITTPAAPPVPGVPVGLALEALSVKSVQISFSGSGQTGFEIQRSVGSDNQFKTFRTITTTDPSVTVIDTGLFAHTLVYYKVRAIGVSGNSDFCDEVSVTTLNSNPVIFPLGTKFIYYEGTSVIPVNAGDPDGDQMTISVSNLPTFATFDSAGNGKSILTFNTQMANMGGYSIYFTVTDAFGGINKDTLQLFVSSNRPPVLNRIRNIEVQEGQVYSNEISAIDLDRRARLSYTLTNPPSFVSGTEWNNTFSLLVTPGYNDAGSYQIPVIVNDHEGGIDSAVINLTVTNVDPTSRVYINVLNGTPAPGTPWNNITSPNTSSLLDQNGNTTGIGISFNASVWRTSSDGKVTGDNSGAFPDVVMRDNYYFGTAGVPPVVNVTLSGLDPNTKYRLTTFSSTTYSGANGKTIFTSQGQSDSIAQKNNTSEKALFNSLMSDGDGKIVVTMSKTPDAPVGYLNAMVLEKPYEDGTAPKAPANLTATALEDGSVKLQWQNMAYNSDGSRLFRSETSDGVYSLISGDEVQYDDSSFVDKSVQSNKTYYYKIIAYNEFGNSDTTGVAQALTLNKVPVLQDISNVFLKAGNNGSVNIVATDDPADVITLTTTGLPGFAQLQNTGNGTATISFQPVAGNEGLYKNIQVTATDNYGASVTKTFNLSVSDNTLRTVMINFDGNEVAPWNNYNAAPNPSTTLSNLTDDVNATTPFNFKFTTTLGGKSEWGMNDANEGIYSDAVMIGAMYVSNTTQQSFQFGGLDPSKKYNVVIFSSYNTGKPGIATFTSGGQSLVVNGSYNDNSNAQLNGLTPDGSGNIVVNFTKDASSDYFMLNALKLEEYNNGDFVKPADLRAEPLVNVKAVRLRWSDRSDSEIGYEVYRSSNPNSGFTRITTTAANVTTFDDSDASLIPGNAYYYKVRAKKSSSVFSDYSNVAQYVLARTKVLVNMNIPGFEQAAPWNNTSDQSSEAGLVVSNLMNTDFQNTGIDFEITQSFFGKGYEGSSTPGILPVIVMRSDYFTDAGKVSSVKFSGLDMRQTYRIGVFSSVVEVTKRYFAIYSINGVSKSIDGQSNNSKIVYFNNVRPDENGEISVDVTPDTRYSPYCFTSAFTLDAFFAPDDSQSQAKEAHHASQEETKVIQAEKTLNIVQPQIRSDFKIMQLNAYPNPFVSNLNAVVEIPSNSSNVSLEMYDLQSRLIFKKEVRNNDQIGGRNLVTLPVGKNLAPGVYILKLSVGNESKTIKVVKTN